MCQQPPPAMAALCGGPASAARRPCAVLCTMGTRGDVQPFVALGLHLVHSRGWRVVVAGPPEYRGFVESHPGLEFEVIGISLQHAINASPQGKALRTASLLTAFAATREFFRLPLLESWFACSRRLLQALRPDVLLLTSFVAMSGTGALPALLGLPTRIILAHTVPFTATGEFSCPLAGTGFSAPAAWLNRLQWQLLQQGVSRTLHEPRAQAIVDGAVAASLKKQSGGGAQERSGPGQEEEEAAAEQEGRHGGPAQLEAAVCCSKPASGGLAGSRPPACQGTASRVPADVRLGPQLTLGQVPTLYIWSPTLLPKPADWPGHCHVTGPLQLKRGQWQQYLQAQPGEAAGMQPAGAASAGAAPAAGEGGKGAALEAVGLPAELQAYLDAAVRHQLPMVYIGLGSMLGTVFSQDKVDYLISCMQQAVLQAAADFPLCAVVHAHGTTPPASVTAGPAPAAAAGKEGVKAAGQAGPAPFLMLHEPVLHELLLPQCSLIVHHGGAGTTQAALLAGKPSLVVPCVPQSDQPWWGDLVARRGLGPAGFPVGQLSAARLADGILRGLRQLDAFTAAAEAVAFGMAREDGVGTAADILEREVRLAMAGVMS